MRHLGRRSELLRSLRTQSLLLLLVCLERRRGGGSLYGTLLRGQLVQLRSLCGFRFKLD